MTTGRPLIVFAPAKINLYLHVNERRDDGYHGIDFLAVFADIGDKIIIEPADDFSFQINGQFAAMFQSRDRDDSATSTNLAVRAARLLARVQNKKLNCRITLTKSLPLASGIGGGSSDAAAVLWGLMTMWEINREPSAWLSELALILGADVPACLRCTPVRMTGIGEDLNFLPYMPEVPVVLVNPMKTCATADVFRRFAGPMRNESALPGPLDRVENLVRFIRERDNDLTPAAIEIVPEIGIVLDVLSKQKNCMVARMSGSGATTFGLFETMDDAEEAATQIAAHHPTWWVRSGTINSPVRY